MATAVLDKLVGLGLPWLQAKEVASATTAAVQIDVVATAGTLTRASGDYRSDGFDVGMTFTGSAFANGGNNADFEIATVTALVITVTDNTGLVDETGSGDEVLTGKPTVARLMSFGMPELMATEVVDVDGEADNAANRVISLPKMMASGLSANLTLEIYDHLADG